MYNIVKQKIYKQRQKRHSYKSVKYEMQNEALIFVHHNFVIALDVNIINISYSSNVC